MTATTLIALLLACSTDKPAETDDISAEGDSAAETTVDTPPPSTAGVIDHLDALAEIADQNGGTRASGTPGYDASVAYVAEKLEAAGYTVTLDAFTFSSYTEDAPPSLSSDEAVYTWGEDFATMIYSGSGEVSGPGIAVDVQIPPGESNSSTSGCEAADFEGFPAGGIAIIQRGSCTFGDKARNAQAAGAVGVVIFNEGQSGRRDIVEGTLGEDDSLTIPVLGATYALGAALVEAGEPAVSMSVSTTRVQIETQNVLAETAAGDPGQVVVVGAHLDSVASGAGINDNGSGSAAVLELAEELARADVALSSQIRFAFWGAEELGLLGSTAYVAALSESERDDILANLNFDMIASPNFVRFIYDGDGSDTPEPGPSGSDAIEQLFVDWFEGQGLDTEPTAFSGRSDYGPFVAVGIPAGGLFSGAEVEKSNLEAKMYGGTSGEPYDRCYHQECDDRGNISEQCLSEMSEAVFAVTLQLAQDPAPFTERSARQHHDLREGMRATPRRGRHFQR